MSFCGYESFILLHTKLWTIERSEGRRGFVCLSVCLFVVWPSGKTRAAGRKEGQLAARILFMRKPSGKTRAEGKKDSSRRDIADYE